LLPQSAELSGEKNHKLSILHSKSEYFRFQIFFFDSVCIYTMRYVGKGIQSKHEIQIHLERVLQHFLFKTSCFVFYYLYSLAVTGLFIGKAFT
jgi:hypothetical protein